MLAIGDDLNVLLCADDLINDDDDRGGSEGNEEISTRTVPMNDKQSIIILEAISLLVAR